MSQSAPKSMIDMFREELALCGVKKGVKVAVLSEGDQLQDYAAAMMAAGRDLGGTMENVHLPAGKAASASERIANIGQNSLSRHPEAMKTCLGADLVVDHMLLLFSREQIEMQNAGVRVILVVEPIEILTRLFPTPDQRRRVEAAEKRLARAARLRFTNDAGTDVTYELDGKPVLTEYGYTDTPGRWDHWPGGFLATLARAGGVNGRVVMKPGDIIYPRMCFVDRGIEFIVRDGRVVEIKGGKDADDLKAFIATYKDDRAFAISHIGWGLNERCQWRVDLPGIGMDGRAYYGNVLFSLGPDTEFGGTNDTACHLDLPMKGCDLFLDDELIVRKGELVPEELRAARH